MSSRIPYCGSCQQKCQAEIAAKRAKKAARRNAKGKAKAEWDSDGSDGGDEDEWGGGEPGIMKVCGSHTAIAYATQPDITFFGQALDSQFDQCLYADREEVDLLVIIGTSLKVAPVSEVLSASLIRR